MRPAQGRSGTATKRRRGPCAGRRLLWTIYACVACYVLLWWPASNRTERRIPTQTSVGVDDGDPSLAAFRARRQQAQHPRTAAPPSHALPAETVGRHVSGPPAAIPRPSCAKRDDAVDPAGSGTIETPAVECRCDTFIGSSLWAVDSRGVRCRANGGLDPVSGCCARLSTDVVADGKAGGHCRLSVPDNVRSDGNVTDVTAAAAETVPPVGLTTASDWREQRVACTSAGPPCCSEPTACVACCIAAAASGEGTPRFSHPANALSSVLRDLLDQRRQAFASGLGDGGVANADVVAAYPRCGGAGGTHRFEACVARCRPGSGAAYHQNRYVSPMHHCYG